MPFPHFHGVVRFAQEEDLAHLFLVRVRVDKEDTFLLFDAGEIKQIRVGLEPQRAIGIGREDVIGIDQGQRIGKHQPLQAGAVLDK